VEKTASLGQSWGLLSGKGLGYFSSVSDTPSERWEKSDWRVKARINELVFLPFFLRESSWTLNSILDGKVSAVGFRLLGEGVVVIPSE